MVTDFFQFNLVNYGGSGQDEVLVQVPDLMVTLQTGFDCRDTAEQVEKQQHLFCLSHFGCWDFEAKAPSETRQNQRKKQFMACRQKNVNLKIKRGLVAALQINKPTG